MLERSSSSSHGIRRLPSFRNFEIPQLPFQRFPSNFGRTWSLAGSYRGTVREQRSDDDLERQELERLTDVNENDGPDIKPESDETVDPNLVTWSSEDDPTNPINWPNRKRWTATLLVACFTFISPLASTMIAPSLDTIAEDFNISKDAEKALVMTIFLLAYAIGPFLIGPLSETFGRVVVLQSANLVFLLFNTVCGFARSKEQMMAFRFLSGLGASAPQAIGGGVVSDCWRAEERGKAIAIYSLAPFLGPSLGPIAGGLITQNTTWRWVFWGTSILDLFVQVLATLFLHETYKPKILAVKAKKLIQETGNTALHTKWQNPDHTFGHILRKNLVRPFVMLATQPTIQVMAFYRAYIYGLKYLVLSTFPMVFEETYNMSIGDASLNYLSLGVGFVIGLQICAPLIDKVYIRLKRHYNSPGRPEFRIPLMLPGGLLVPLGLLIYGFTARSTIHFIVPNIGAAIFACGCIISFQCAQAYVVDAYTTYAASATGAAAFVRTIAGFGFPLFAGKLYGGLGVGWGNAVLAFVALGVGIPAPILFWRYGERIRARSTYCAGPIYYRAKLITIMFDL
ncbi:major facilitator superfamily domain-containing protein [Cadophora sp. MPI-SDFR-AT-0126]|nr:major facilitator superfamily domain-containing protein [Leotiomycetes sp. MPI-SDFR-AT-0126]